MNVVRRRALLVAGARRSTPSGPRSGDAREELGTLVTACGMPTATWPKFLDVPFPGAGFENCPTCRSATALDPVNRQTGRLT